MFPPGGWVRLSVAGLAVIMGGCSSQSDPELAPVHGVIRYQGRPLENAQVVFLPDRPGASLSMGTTDNNGRYELMTNVPGDGAALGRHRVTVTARGPDTTISDPEEQVEGLAVDVDGGQPAITPGPPLIPEKYFSFDTSGLTAEVTAPVTKEDEGVAVDFDLTDE